MTPERRQQIRYLVTHPAGVSRVWAKKLLLELLEEVERLSEALGEDND